MTREQLDLILQQHELWLEDDTKGKCANLSLVNLRGFDLSNVNLSGANLERANLRDVNLCGANLSSANLQYAYLRKANLSSADLDKANLTYSVLQYADLSCASLYKANLSYADFRYANLTKSALYEANLIGANLTNSKLDDIRYDGATSFFALQCPESGSFTAYKASHDYIVELLIPKNAKRSSATNRKCRANKAKVIAIYNLDRTKSDLTEIASEYDETFIYKVGKTLTVKDFDENRWEDCSTGIHFFITFDEAKQYWR